MTENILVAVRVRPLNVKEIEAGNNQFNDGFAWKIESNNIAQLSPKGKLVSPSSSSSSYSFDHIFTPDDSTELIYSNLCKGLIRSTVIDGINGTIFAYGQTSSGKTHTMQGTKSDPGIIPLAIADIFDLIQNTQDREFNLRVSYMEIYNENIRDLLAPSDKEGKNLRIREDKNGVFIQNITEKSVGSPSQLFHIMDIGQAKRTTGATNANDFSSRSHSIFKIVVESRPRFESPLDSSKEKEGRWRVSEINLVDLAGSERVSITKAKGLRLREGGHINKSLLTLSFVVGKLSNLQTAKGYIPYRNSKLTRILQPALGGSSLTTIICAITPSCSYVDETNSTLKFANSAKKVKISPVANEDPKNNQNNHLLIENNNLLLMENNNLVEQIMKMRQAFSDMEKSNDKLNETIGKMEEKIGELELECQCNQWDLAKLKEEKKLLKSANSDLQNELLNEKNSSGKLAQKLVQMEKENADNLAQKVAQVEDHSVKLIEEKDKMIENKEKLIEEYEKRLAEYEKKFIDSENEIEEKNKKIEEVKTQSNDQENKINELNKQIVERDRQITKYEKTIADKNTEISNQIQFLKAEARLQITQKEKLLDEKEKQIKLLSCEKENEINQTKISVEKSFEISLQKTKDSFENTLKRNKEKYVKLINELKTKRKEERKNYETTRNQFLAQSKEIQTDIVNMKNVYKNEIIKLQKENQELKKLSKSNEKKHKNARSKKIDSIVEILNNELNDDLNVDLSVSMDLD